MPSGDWPSEADMLEWELEYERSRSRIDRLRDAHHWKAMCVATWGDGEHQISEEMLAHMCGLTPQRLQLLRVDPSFKDLVAHYRGRLGK